MRTRRLFFSLLAIGFFLVFVQASAPSLDSDGIHYGAVAKEIARSGRWLLPFDPVNNTPYYWHLHGSLWPTAVVFRWFGVSVLTAKLYSMAMTLVALAGIFVLGRMLISPWGGWCAGIAFLSTNHVLRIARQCRVDLPLVGYIVWAYVGILRAQTGSRGWYLLAGAASLGAVMTKEIVGLVPLATAAAYLLLHRKWRHLFSPFFWAAWAIALVPPIVITLMEQKIYQVTLWNSYYQQNFLFFLEQGEHLRQPWYYYLWAIGDKYGYMLPLALPGAWFAWRELRSGREPRWMLLFLWVVAFPLGFSRALHKVHYYILPIYAATALWVGLAFERWIPQRMRPRIVATVLALATIAGGGLTFLPVSIHKARYRNNVEIAPKLSALLKEAPGDLILFHEDVASLLFYSDVARVNPAHNDTQFWEELGRTVDYRRYMLISHVNWKRLDPAIRNRWFQLFDDGGRYLLLETSVTGV